MLLARGSDGRSLVRKKNKTTPCPATRTDSTSSCQNLHCGWLFTYHSMLAERIKVVPRPASILAAKGDARCGNKRPRGVQMERNQTQKPGSRQYGPGYGDLVGDEGG